MKRIPIVLLLLCLSACSSTRDRSACHGKLRPINTLLQEHHDEKR